MMSCYLNLNICLSKLPTVYRFAKHKRDTMCTAKKLQLHAFQPVYTKTSSILQEHNAKRPKCSVVNCAMKNLMSLSICTCVSPDYISHEHTPQTHTFKLIEKHKYMYI